MEFMAEVAHIWWDILEMAKICIGFEIDYFEQLLAFVEFE